MTTKDSKEPNGSFDQKLFMTNFHGMEDLAYQTIESFIGALPKLVSDVEVAIKTNNAADLELSAHTLKGALSNFYAERSKLLAWQLEQAGHGKITPMAEQVFQSLKLELARLSSDLEAFMNQRKTS